MINENITSFEHSLCYYYDKYLTKSLIYEHDKRLYKGFINNKLSKSKTNVCIINSYRFKWQREKTTDLNKPILCYSLILGYFYGYSIYSGGDKMFGVDIGFRTASMKLLYNNFVVEFKTNFIIKLFQELRLSNDLELFICLGYRDFMIKLGKFVSLYSIKYTNEGFMFNKLYSNLLDYNSFADSNILNNGLYKSPGSVFYDWMVGFQTPFINVFNIIKSITYYYN